MGEPQRRKLAVILHADVVGSTALVRRDETLAHERMQGAFRRLAEAAACYARIGDQAGAAELVAAVLRLNPRFSIARHMRMRTYCDPADAAHLAEGLRAAGLPE